MQTLYQNYRYKKEVLKRAHSKAINDLESYIYLIRDKITDDDLQPYFVSEESEKIKELLDSTSEFLEENDESSGTQTQTYVDKRKSLADLFEQIINRREQHKNLPAAIEECNKAIQTSTGLLAFAKSVDPEKDEDGLKAAAASLQEVGFSFF